MPEAFTPVNKILQRETKFILDKVLEELRIENIDPDFYLRLGSLMETFGISDPMDYLSGTSLTRNASGAQRHTPGVDIQAAIENNYTGRGRQP